jgi:DNA-binding GntR family transcriptional regulator
MLLAIREHLIAMRQTVDITGALRKAIVDGHFMPNERLIEVDLAARFGTTRAQIRGALSTLESEGLVVSEPNRGARVRFVTAAEAIELTEVRASVEALIAAKAAERASPEDIARLDDILAKMRTANAENDLLRYSALNGELHTELRRISRHALATKLLLMLNSQIIRFQFRAILIPGRASKSLAEHESIVEAIKVHHPERARIAMRHHLTQVVGSLKHAIETQGMMLGAAAQVASIGPRSADGDALDV